MVCSIVVIAADYLISNLSFPLLDESEPLTLLGLLQHGQNTEDYDSVFFINTGIDKQLAPVESFDSIVGHIPITDREALLKFLNIAEGSGYKYIIMDIRFEEGLHTPADSALFSKIASLPLISISDHRADDEYSIADSVLMPRAAMADYRSSMYSGFTRFEFLQDGRESVPLRVYRELTGKGMEQKGPLYFSDGKLCYNLQFVRMPIEAAEKYGRWGEVKYRYLSANILWDYPPEELRGMMKNKIVIIGDFDNDVIQTYIGDVPGPLVLYYSYKVLERGAHRVNLIYMLSLFVIYTLVCYCILSGGNVIRKITEKLKITSPLTLFILSLGGWGLLLGFIKVIVYLTLGLSYIALLPSLMFSLLELPAAIRSHHH